MSVHQRLESETVRPRPWLKRKATTTLGRSLGHYSLYDADGEFVAGGFSAREADMIVRTMTLYGAAKRAQRARDD